MVNKKDKRDEEKGIAPGSLRSPVSIIAYELTAGQCTIPLVPI